MKPQDKENMLKKYVRGKKMPELSQWLKASVGTVGLKQKPMSQSKSCYSVTWTSDQVYELAFYIVS